MTERLLLDTHVLLWWSATPERLSQGLQEVIRDADQVFVSAASAWEVAIKVRLGRLDLPGPFSEAVSLAGFSSLPVTFAHAEETRSLPMHHRDPFDRLLVAVARVEGLRLVSADPAVLAYPVTSIPSAAAGA